MWEQDYEFPNGKVVTVRSPKRLSKQELLRHIADNPELTPKTVALGPEATAQAAKDEMAEHSPFAKFAYGAGRAPQTVYSGIKQLVTGSDPQQENQEATARALEEAGGGATTAGRIVGEIGQTLIPGGALTKAGLLPKVLPKAAQLAAPVATSAAIEAARPTVGDESRVSAAGRGAAYGAGGVAVGKVANKVLPMALNVPGKMFGVRKVNPEAQELMDQGVRVPPWQQQEKGVIRTLAERARKLPVTGQQIKARELESFKDLNRWQVGQATPPKPILDEAGGVLRWEGQQTKNIGPRGVRELADGFDNAYDAIYQGRTVPIDEAFRSNVDQVAGEVEKYYPQLQGEVHGALREVQDLMAPSRPTTAHVPGGRLVDAQGRQLVPPSVQTTPGREGATAEGVKAAIGRLNKRIDAAYASGNGALAEVYVSLRGSLDELRARGLPPEVAPELDKVNKAYRSFVQYRDAMSAATAQKAEMASPEALLRSAQQQTKSKTTKAAGEGENVPFLSKANRVLGSELPRVGPGTADTLLAFAPGIAGGGLFGTGALLGNDWMMNAGLGLALSPTGGRILTGDTRAQRKMVEAAKRLREKDLSQFGAAGVRGYEED